MNKLVLVIITILCISQILAEGAKYLIIAPDNFISALQPLADWKTKKGVKAMIVPLSVTGNTAVQIKNYILNAYNTWTIRPEYVLLAGLGTVVPASGSSDDYFANMDSNYRIELGIGRFPCVTAVQIENIVNKTLSYEKTPYLVDTTWYRKGTTIVREDYPPDPYYQPDCRYIRNLMLVAGYVHTDSFLSTAGHTAADVENAITDGRAFVAYRGQAMVNWWAPFNVDPTRINNGYKLPVIVSGTCATISLSTSGYLGDRFINVGSTTEPKGAVAFWGTTGIGTAIYVGTITKGFFHVVFEEGILKLGDAAKRAKFILDSLFHNQNRYQEWNLYGDPELNLWTAVPKPVSVTYDSAITANPTNVTVTVTSNGVPVPNALVCLMKDTTIYVYGNTDSNGVKVFSISPQDTGTISITVTARNCHPFEGTIRVLSSGVEESPVVKFQASSFTLQVCPNPARTFLAIRLPHSEACSEIKIFDVTGKLTKEIATSASQTRNDNIIRVSLSGIKDGIYFVRLRKETKKIVVNK